MTSSFTADVIAINSSDRSGFQLYRWLVGLDVDSFADLVKSTHIHTDAFRKSCGRASTSTSVKPLTTRALNSSIAGASPTNSIRTLVRIFSVNETTENPYAEYCP
jgi:hypothetical protein